jgi:predicted Zn-dependent protease
VNQAILELDPANPVATNRVAAALFNADRLDDAEDVLIAGLRAHPDNQFMHGPLKRVCDRRAMSRRGPADAWVKAVHYYGDGWTIEPGEVASRRRTQMR